MQLKNKNRQLHKFGGSSLADAKCYMRVATIIAKYSMPDDIMIVSASGNTTNQLIKLVNLSKINHLSAYRIQQSLINYQINLIMGLIPLKDVDILINNFINDIKKLNKLLNNNITDAISAEIISYGEIWSARLMAAVLEYRGLESIWLDSREFLRAEFAAQPKINAKISYNLLKKILLQYAGKRIVITGFISRNSIGETVLLGRHGSDYSATQIGALIGVSCITIWSDVSGIYSADPHKIKDACLIPLISINEANELARLAIPILHARTLQPIINSNIDLQLRCSFYPDRECTKIKHVTDNNKGTNVILGHDNICLIEFQVLSVKNFKLIKKNINFLFKKTQIYPLATYIHDNRQLFQFCYTTELANSALKIISKYNLSGDLSLRHNLALIAIVGTGITNNNLYCNYFFEHLKGLPVEFTWKSKNGISLVAVLSSGPTEKIIKELHKDIFFKEKNIKPMIINKKSTDTYWLNHPNLNKRYIDMY